jgi:CBS domain-containing protein
MTAVKDIMTTVVITIDFNKSAFEAAELMSAKGIGCLVITEKNVTVGIVTERDFVRRIIAKRASLDTQISEIMSKPIITVDPNSSTKEAARLMSTNKVHRLPVLKNNKLVGIVVATDLVRNESKKSMSEEILEAVGRYPPGSL